VSSLKRIADGFCEQSSFAYFSPKEK